MLYVTTNLFIALVFRLIEETVEFHTFGGLSLGRILALL